MPICKFCNKIIEHLERKATGVEKSRFFIENGSADYDDEEFESDGEFEMYMCPECSEELFDSWEQAEEFLKDKDKVAEMVAKKINQEEVKNGTKNN